MSKPRQLLRRWKLPQLNGLECGRRVPWLSRQSRLRGASCWGGWTCLLALTGVLRTSGSLLASGHRLLRRMQNLHRRNSTRNVQAVGAVGREQASRRIVPDATTVSELPSRRTCQKR
ncbi:unnamed protein product [Lampetra planeri]